MAIENIEELANGYLDSAREARDGGNIERARKHFAISWGFNKYLERMDFLEICTRSLKLTGLDSEEIKIHQMYGEDMARYSIDLGNVIEKFLFKQR